MATQTGSISFESTKGLQSYAKQNYATLSQIKGQFATCGTGKTAPAKEATIVPADSGWTLYNGATITVKFTSENSTAAPTLNVNSTGAKPIKDYAGNALTSDAYNWPAGAAMSFTYDGSSWRLQDSDLMERVHEAETGIEQNATSITSFATMNSTYTDPQGNTVENKAKSYVDQTAQGITQSVSDTYATKNELSNVETSVSQTADSITSLAAANATYTAPDGTTQTNQTAAKLELKANKATLTSEINASADTVKINADRIEINGTTTFKNGNTTTTVSDYLDANYDEYGAASAVADTIPENLSDLTNDLSLLWQGTCSTASGTAAKTVTCAGFELKTGATVTVRFTTASTDNAPTLNVNSTGTKNIFFNNTIVSATNMLKWAANAIITFVYDGTQFRVAGEPRSWYTTCSIAAGTAEKTATINEFVMCKGTSVNVQMTNANTVANPTLNISSLGALAIYTAGARPAANSPHNWTANSTVNFIFDGQYWCYDSDASVKAKNTADALNTYITNNDAALQLLQNQVDGQIEAWYQTTDPATTAYAATTTPTDTIAASWTTEQLKERHLGDLYYNVNNGHSWRWMKSGTTYSWTVIPDSDAAAALGKAKLALDTANGKRRIFTTQPTGPYDVGDLWVNVGSGSTGTQIKYCNMANATTGAYTANHWTVAATDDTVANNAAPKSSAVSRTQRIYYRTNTALSSSITGPTTWIIKSDNGFNTVAPTTATTGWSTKPTPLAVSTASDATKYLYLYTCIQTQTVAQAANSETECTASTVLLDDTETVIDGGKIITGSVTTNQIAANAVTAEKINVTDLQAIGATIGGFDITTTAIKTKNIAVISNEDNSIALSSTDFTRTINGTSRAGLRLAIGDKFGVTGDGAIYASSVDLTGKITATSGTIGGCTISNGVLQVANANITGSISGSKINASEINIGNLAGEIGGRNLYLKTGGDFFTNVGGGNISGATSTVSNDGTILTITRPANTNQAGRYITPNVTRTVAGTLVVGETYTISFDAKASVASGVSFNSIAEAQTVLAHSTYDLTNSWQRIWVTFTVTSGHATQAICFYTSGTASATYDIKLLKLEKGNRATDWTPAPEDIDNAIDDAAQTATNYITSIDTNKGITVKPSDSSGNDYLQMNSTDIRFVRNNVDVMNLTDNTFRLGTASGKHITINTDGLNLWNGAESIATNKIASFGTTATIGATNNAHFIMAADKLQAYNSSNVKYFEVSSSGLTWGSNTAATTTSVSEANNAANTVVTVYPTAIDYAAGTATLAVKCMRGTTAITPSAYLWTKGTSTVSIGAGETLSVTDLNAVYNCTVTITV